ncbi:hypothetical protein GCM10009846_09550 [Agrococcus versicolor]|uniref:Phospholipid/glycerol acyltransferase domain-containing protein n=1 Tax=Agrococcus versicolor TaxID=501482 RepID=A0ABN3AM24_9MICO
MADARQHRDRFDSKAHEVARFGAQRGLLKSAVHATVTLRVVDEQRAAALEGKPFILVANHSSHLDAPVILSALPWRIAKTLAIGAAADYFFDVWWRRGLTALFFNAFPVQRSGRRKQVVSAKSLLERGIPVLLFPEGTRSKTGRMADFRPGSAALATNLGVPILPVAIIGAHDAHPRGTSWPKPGRLPVTVVFGDAIAPNEGENARDLTTRVRAEVVRLLAAHGGPDPRELQA